MKYGYLLNSEGCRPENFGGSCGNDKFSVFAFGTESQEVAYEAVRILVEEKQIDMLDLCEDFQDDRKEDLIEKMGLAIPVHNAKFTEKQRAKLDDVDWYKYAVIVLGEDLDPATDVIRQTNPACDLYLYGVGTVEQGCEVVKRLRTEDGVEFFFVSSTFGEDGTEAIVDALDSTGLIYALESAALNITYGEE